jgi:cysteine-rich repeat protein
LQTVTIASYRRVGFTIPIVSSDRCYRLGFSLIELILFTGIIAIMAGAIVGFSLVSSSISSRSETVAEVEKTGELVSHRITRAVQDADIIVYPPIGQVQDSLLLVQASPLKEIFFQVHHGYVRMIETVNGTPSISYLTTDDVNIGQMLFLHTGSAGNEGISFAYSVANEAVGTEMLAGQYVKSFRGTISLHANVCAVSADCNVPGGEECCGGVCYNTGGGGCPACVSVADCGTSPTCNPTTCTWEVPYCASGNTCAVLESGPCSACNWCGDGDSDESGEECDDGCLSPGFPPGCDANGSNGNDQCTRGCLTAECGDGIINTLEEECDDGNLKNNDGCDSTCMTEILCGNPAFAVDVAFVIDMSSSMGQGKQLREIQAALKKFVEFMDFSKDKAAVVAYSTEATVVQPLTNNEQSVKNAIDALNPGGQRNLQQGILKGQAELAGGSGNKKVMIVLAGNKPTRWDSPAQSCSQTSPPADECHAIAAASAAKVSGTYIFSVGLGVGTVAEDLLKAIRTAPPDTLSDYYYYAPIVRDLLAVYVQISDDICPCDDGVVSGGETCDDANDNNNDGCTNLCQNWSCGDGIVANGFEQCEPPSFGCTAGCMYDISLTCGNGTVEGSELCDDGNTVSNDGCSGIESGIPAKYCKPEIFIPPYCHVNNEPCFFDDDCGEPDPVTCAVCTDGQCTTCVPAAEVCSDGKDNDCDGLADCADTSSCPNDTTCAVDMTCQSGVCVPAICDDGRCDRGEACSLDCSTEKYCDDNVDNNQDWDTDCQDYTACPDGTKCAEGGYVCAMSLCVKEICNNSFDDDGDFLSDCEDTDCYTDPLCCGDTYCRLGESCASDCTTEQYCEDSVDNDADGDSDCVDSDCAGVIVKVTECNSPVVLDFDTVSSVPVDVGEQFKAQGVIFNNASAGVQFEDDTGPGNDIPSCSWDVPAIPCDPQIQIDLNSSPAETMDVRFTDPGTTNPRNVDCFVVRQSSPDVTNLLRFYNSSDTLIRTIQSSGQADNYDCGGFYGTWRVGGMVCGGGDIIRYVRMSTSGVDQTFETFDYEYSLTGGANNKTSCP